MSDWVWRLATDADEAHRLLCASDAHHAAPGRPAPQRDLSVTRRHVSNRATHILRQGGEAAAMFTLTWEPRFSIEATAFPMARKPIYLCRLAVRPAWLETGSLVGAQTLRRVVETATTAGADAVRSEANPDLHKTYALLKAFGFRPYPIEEPPGGLSRVHLQLTLD